jgi:hypothetical protein
MSLSVDGVWKAGVWATTVWADGVWREGAFVEPVAGDAGVVLLPPIPIPHNWLLLERGFDIEGDRAFQELARRNEVEGLIREALQDGEVEVDLYEMDGLEPDEDLFGKRTRRRKWRG